MKRAFIHALFWLAVSMPQVFARAEQTIDPDAKAWMQAALDNWQTICRDQLHLAVEPLPWIIFYDEDHAWHVGADESVLPSPQPAGFALSFNGRSVPVTRVEALPGHKLWVPDRPPLAIADARILTAPYASGTKSYVICALPSLVQRSLARPISATFSKFLIGIVGHELVHTRQVFDVGLRFAALEKRYTLPKSFDDNIVETTFSTRSDYRTLYDPEQGKLFTAALQDDEPDTEKKLVTEALALMRARRARFFTADYASFSELEDIYLMMEGIGQWVHFQAVRKSAPQNQPWQQTALDFQKETNSWIQTEGFAIFLLIDRWVPNWQKRFFASDFPSPFVVLEEALHSKENKLQ